MNSHFDTPVSNPEEFITLIARFNEQYKSSFVVVGEENNDGVIFIEVDPNGAALNLIFSLGIQYGCLVQKRSDEENKLYWG